MNEQRNAALIGGQDGRQGNQQVSIASFGSGEESELQFRDRKKGKQKKGGDGSG